MTGARIHSGKKTDKSPKPLTKLDPIGQTTNKKATQETTNKHEPVSTRKHTRLESHSKSHHNYGNVDPNGYNSAPRAWESPWGKTQVGAVGWEPHGSSPTTCAGKADHGFGVCLSLALICLLKIVNLTVLLHKEFEIQTLHSKFFRILKFAFLSEVAHKSFCVKKSVFLN